MKCSKVSHFYLVCPGDLTSASILGAITRPPKNKVIISINYDL